ncbi:TPA: hypothetical protein JLG19_000579 [Escherichia coli]|nr:hypothetical protein [Escherichia coli]
MANYIDVDRRFYKHTNPLEEIPKQIYVDWFEDNGSAGWSELLKYSRVIILAEAGMGKTREMKEQSIKLNQAGQFSFVIPTEALTEEHIVDILPPDDKARFEQWEKCSEHAYFFLDAVDELKLKGDKFEKLLRKLRPQLEKHLSRVRLIISCRPSDWNNYDLALLKQWLPVNSHTENQIMSASHKSGREFFKDTVSGWFSQPVHNDPLEELEKGMEPKAEEYHQVHCFHMRPMTNQQIKKFTRGSVVSEPERFLQQLHALNAEVFTSRPQDLLSLIAYWNTHKQFDSELVLHEADIKNKLTENYERCEQVIKSPREIRDAVERLALAMSLTRKYTINIAESSIPDGLSLNPAKILTDWLPKDINALLRLAIFEPATYERVRFHHRSVQEYLAACRLRYLKAKGMSIGACFNLLFSERCNFSVVVPSMRPIAAWLSLWDRNVREELTHRAPEVLFLLGDPSSLPVEVRSELLKSFVSHYKHGLSRGINIPLMQVARFSHPEIQPVIEQLWAEGYPNEDVRELLLEIIWTGKLQDCNELLEHTVYDSNIDITDRLVAIKAIAATNDLTLQQKIVHDVINVSELWPDKFIFHFAEELFPQLLSIDDLLVLIKRTTEPSGSTNGFKRALYNVAAEIVPDSDAAIAFRDRIALLILDNSEESRHYYPESQYGHLTRSLAKICARQLASNVKPDDEPLIFACLVCRLFSKAESHYINDELSAIKSVLNSITPIREVIFLTEWHLLTRVVKHDIDDFQLKEYSVLSDFGKDDLPWMISLLDNKSFLQSRTILLKFLFQFTPLIDNLSEFQVPLTNAINDDEALLSLACERLKPRSDNVEYIRSQEDRKEKERIRQKVEKEKQNKEIEEWLNWYDTFTTDITWTLSADRQYSVLSRIVNIMQKTHKGYFPEDFWDKKLLHTSFNDSYVKQIEKSFQQYWRNTPTQLWHARDKEHKNSLTQSEIIAFTGLFVESESQGWEKMLSHDETSLAIKYATLSCNNFAPFICELAVPFPDIVKAAIGIALQDAIYYIDNDNYIPIISQISSADISLRKLLSDDLLKAANCYLLNNKECAISNIPLSVEQLLTSLADVISDDKRMFTAQICADFYKTAPYNPGYYSFLKYTFIFSPDTGLEIFQKMLRRCQDKVQYITGLYAALFSHRASRRNHLLFNDNDPSQQISLTGKLLNIAYQFIRREDDREHDDVYTPDTRDRAEEARGVLLDRLLNTRDDKAVVELLRIAKKPHCRLSKERLEYLARERAALNSDEFSLTEGAVLELESHLEQPPHSQKSLYQVMVNRLHDLQYALSHSDFTDRDILRTVKLEAHMQSTLAWRLEAAAKSAYSVVRESEVADGKKTDIRLISPCGKHKAVIELKLADKRWNVAAFVRALEHQLVGQYLRYDGCKTGCLLLTYNGNKKYWQKPGSRDRLYFKDLINYLNEKANIIMTENRALQLTVIGLDLTAPKLVPAHKSILSRSE